MRSKIMKASGEMTVFLLILLGAIAWLFLTM